MFRIEYRDFMTRFSYILPKIAIGIKHAFALPRQNVTEPMIMFKGGGGGQIFV